MSTDRRKRQDPHAPGNRSSDLAWAAAIFEGEGSARLTTTPHVGVTNTDRSILARLQAIFGLGRIRPCGGTNRAAFRWEVYGSNAQLFLSRIAPYLVSKRDQADLLLAHRPNRQGHALTEAERHARREVRLQLAWLKRHPNQNYLPALHPPRTPLTP